MNIERKFYTEMLKEIMDNNWDDVRELLHTKGQSEKYIRVLSPEKIKWFENLQKYVLTFAKNGRLDVKMYTSDDWCGIIRFETSYFELSDFAKLLGISLPDGSTVHYTQRDYFYDRIHI